MRYNPKLVGPRLKEVMNVLGITQLEVAARSGVDHHTFSNLLNGHFIPSITVLCKVLEVIPMKIDKLLEEEEVTAKEPVKRKYKKRTNNMQ